MAGVFFIKSLVKTAAILNKNRSLIGRKENCPWGN